MDSSIDTLIIKYAFTYGPLMIFFFAVGYAIYKVSPAAVALFREIIAAMNSSTIALNNSTSAISANNDAMLRHHETMTKMWDEMRERIDTFQCPVHQASALPTSRRRQPSKPKSSSRKVHVCVEHREAA